MLCLSLLFSVPDTYTNVFNAHSLRSCVALGSPNGDPVACLRELIQRLSEEVVGMDVV